MTKVDTAHQETPSDASVLAAAEWPVRVLCVDDDSQRLHSSITVLRRVDQRTETETDGVATWATLQVKGFDLPVILASADLPWAEPDCHEWFPPIVTQARPNSNVQSLTMVNPVFFHSSAASALREGAPGDFSRK